MTTDLPVPDEAAEALRDAQYELEGYDSPVLIPSTVLSPMVPSIATPVVVAELLALAKEVVDLPVSDGVDPDGFDAARWAFRELIADRCDELGVKVEEL